MVIEEFKIVEILNKTLDTREASTRLFQEIIQNCTNCNKIELDFNEVEFMSRSFADQFHKEKLQLQSERQVLVEIKNATFQIIEILEAVSRTQHSRKEINTEVQILSFSDIHKMEDYIFAW